jgi:hypothetical protein
MRSFEAAILAELRTITGNKKIRQKDIQEWRTAKIDPHEGETVVHLPTTGVWVAYKLPEPKP